MAADLQHKCLCATALLCVHLGREQPKVGGSPTSHLQQRLGRKEPPIWNELESVPPKSPAPNL